jgi:hypothetical protein
MGQEIEKRTAEQQPVNHYFYKSVFLQQNEKS